MFDPDSDDYVEDGVVSDDEELGFDTHIPQVETRFTGGAGSHIPRIIPDEPLGEVSTDLDPPRRRARIRPMPAQLAAHFPHVRTILLTMDNGQQQLLVRRG